MDKAKFLVKGLIAVLFFSIILFISAGKLFYTQGWIFFTTNLAATLINFITIQNNIDLMNERSKIREGTKSWDKLILGLSSLIYIITIILAGLDSGRYQWSPHFSWMIYMVGILLTFSGQIIFLIARKQNKFFSSVVRIQTERGHTVCDRGLYKVVRHPGYLGMIISLIGLPLLLGSIWCQIPTLIAIILLFIRTNLEDKTLRNELNGYMDYTKNTRVKLIPWIW